MKKKLVIIMAVIALVAILGTVLVACNSEKDYRKRLQDAGYELLNKDDFESMVGIDTIDNENWESVEWLVGGIKISLFSIATSNFDMAFVIKFKYIDKAKDFYDEVDAEKDEEFVVERNGKIVIIGTSQGIKDAQGK